MCPSFRAYHTEKIEAFVIPRFAAAAAFTTLILTAGLLAGPDATQPPDASAASDGAAVFASHCSGCHSADDARAPSPEVLRGRSPQAILDALTAGSMKYQGLALSGEQRRAVAEYLTGRKLRAPLSGSTIGNCVRRPPPGDPRAGPQWNGWGPSIDNTHVQPADQAGLTAAQVPQLHLKWAFGFPDATSAWAQPTVVGGRLYVGSQNGTVYSLDAASGCVRGRSSRRAACVRPISIGNIRPSGYTAYFADQKGFVYAVDAATGKSIWVRKVDDHPLVRLTGSPVLYADRLYVPTSSYEEGGKPPGYACCTFRGSIVALDARSGEVVWKSYTIAEEPHLLRVYADGTELRGPSGGAIWSAPTIDARRGALYVGVGNTYSGAAQPTTDAVLALDLKTGKLRWARQMAPSTPDVFGCTPGDVNCGERAGPDFDFGASPVLATLAGGRQLIVAGQKSGVVYALDPDKKGEQVWRYRAGGGSGLGGIQWGIAADAEHAYVPVAEIYSPTPGGLHAVDLATGARVWYSPPETPVCGKLSRACSGAQFSAVSAIPGIVFSPSNDGAVRAHSTADGRVVWTFDTNKEFPTINGLRAKGGSMNGPAPVIAGGLVYVSSGYGVFGLRPGNVLLAFGVD